MRFPGGYPSGTVRYEIERIFLNALREYCGMCLVVSRPQIFNDSPHSDWKPT
jgi:hypothetical protein